MVLLAWSAVGFATGYTNGYHSLLWLRILLGFFEAGHWPCGVKAVRSLLDARGRTLGNGLLQSGTSIGAIVTPLAMLAMLTDEPGSWRRAFQVIASIGVIWIVCWFATVRRNDVDTVRATKQTDRDPWWRVLKQRRMWIVLCVIALINTTWQLMRAWLPKFMQEGHGYSQEAMLSFNAVWFAATDISCLGVGFVVIALAKRGWNLHHARLCAFLACSLCCLSTLVLPWLDAGGMLLALLLVAGAGALGVFPIYHAYTQDISGAHQGKVTGIAGVAAWAFSPLAQKLFGRLIDATGSFNGFAVIGCLPLLAGIILYLFWGSDKKAGD
jgi:ACS family hexuronate transporter-like MFS transporter